MATGHRRYLSRCTIVVVIKAIGGGKKASGEVWENSEGLESSVPSPALFGDRRFTATSQMEDGSDLKTISLERIARERQGRLSWSELQPRTN